MYDDETAAVYDLTEQMASRWPHLYQGNGSAVWIEPEPPQREDNLRLSVWRGMNRDLDLARDLPVGAARPEAVHAALYAIPGPQPIVQARLDEEDLAWQRDAHSSGTGDEEGRWRRS